MNTLQLEYLIDNNQCLKSVVNGVYASNTLPLTVVNFPSVYIVNTDPLPKKGSHWVVIAYLNRNHSEFFDSFGKNPRAYGNDIADFIERNSINCTSFKRQIQSNFSESCGFFVLLYIIMRMCFHLSLNEINKLFSNDLERNEQFVFSQLCKYL